ncbi:MAG: HAD family hydrolase [Marinifilaceae bacterium]
MLDKNTIITFDLDDTIFKEIDFLRSAYFYIADYLDPCDKFLAGRMFSCYRKGENVFDYLVGNYKCSKDKLLSIYRNHQPSVSLTPDVEYVLKKLKSRGCKLGLITDGREITQKNKIKALGIEQFFETILISEVTGYTKSNLYNFELLQNKVKGEQYVYIGDNVNKDFYAPNQLGWNTICLLDDGRNIHLQNFSQGKEYLPKSIIKSLKDIL